MHSTLMERGALKYAVVFFLIGGFIVRGVPLAGFSVIFRLLQS